MGAGVRQASVGERLPRAQKGPRAPDVQNVLGDLEAMFEDARRALETKDLEIIESMAFYLGYQWGISTENGWQVEDTDEAQEVYNYILPTVRSAVASMLRGMPNPEVVAASNTFDARIRARATQNLVRSMLRNGTIDCEELIRGETDAAIKGAVWYKVYFDPSAGRVVKAPKFNPVQGPTGEVQWQPQLDPMTGQPVMVDQFEGAVKIVARDICDILPDPNATKEDEVGYLFDRKLIARWKLEDLFPADAFGMPTASRFAEAKPDRAVAARDLIENRTRGSGIMAQGGKAPQNELCEVIEYWAKPTRKYPKGRLVVWSGDVVIADADLPYDWPWVLRNGQNIIPNGLYAMGVVHPLKPMQRTINLNASKRREWEDKILSPPILASHEAELAPEAPGDIAGEIWRYSIAGGKPEWMQVPSIPAALFEVETLLVNTIKDVSTYTDIARGDSPANIETGRALAYLYEFQEGVREPDVLLFKVVIVRILQKALKLIRDFYSDGRLVKLIGKNNSWMLSTFRRQDYDFDAELEIEADGGQPNSRALRIAEMTEWYQMGVFGETPDAARFRKLMKIDTGESSTFDDDEAAEDRIISNLTAVREDPMFPLVAEERDDPQIALDVLDMFRVSPEYDELPPIARESVDNYVAQFEARYEEQQMNFAWQQSVMGGKGQAQGDPAGGSSKQAASPRDGGQSDISALPFEGPVGADESKQQAVA